MATLIIGVPPVLLLGSYRLPLLLTGITLDLIVQLIPLTYSCTTLELRQVHRVTTLESERNASPMCAVVWRTAFRVLVELPCWLAGLVVVVTGWRFPTLWHRIRAVFHADDVSVGVNAGATNVEAGTLSKRHQKIASAARACAAEGGWWLCDVPFIPVAISIVVCAPWRSMSLGYSLAKARRWNPAITTSHTGRQSILDHLVLSILDLPCMVLSVVILLTLYRAPVVWQRIN